MPPGHLLRLADAYAEWGVKATCIAGGGEPLCNAEVPGMIARLADVGVESAMITNGVLLYHAVADVLVEHSRFCGVSCDGATRETYAAMRGADHLPKVQEDIRRLCELKRQRGSRLQVTLKYLIHPYNYLELPVVARMARDLGCDCVHIRPAGLDNVPGVTDPTAQPGFDREGYAKAVNDLIAEAETLAATGFDVRAQREKFGPQLERVIRFDRCRCTPLAGVFGADGWFHLCFSMRGREGYRLARHDPDPQAVIRAWGSDRHSELVRAIDPSRCMRCAFTGYNEFIEQAVCTDAMYRNFL